MWAIVVGSVLAVLFCSACVWIPYAYDLRCRKLLELNQKLAELNGRYLRECAKAEKLDADIALLKQQLADLQDTDEAFVKGYVKM